MGSEKDLQGAGYGTSKPVRGDKEKYTRKEAC
jgi:hypothetical protein